MGESEHIISIDFFLRGAYKECDGWDNIDDQASRRDTLTFLCLRCLNLNDWSGNP